MSTGKAPYSFGNALAIFGFILPVSTLPNAIAYGTGRIQSRDMLRTGMWFEIQARYSSPVFWLLYFFLPVFDQAEHWQLEDLCDSIE